MKKILIYTFAIFGLLNFTTSCSDFGDVNNDPEHLNEGNLDYRLMFTQVQSQIAGSDWDVWRNGIIYCSNMMQQTSSVDWSQGVFYTWSSDFNAAYWDGFYAITRGAIFNITQVMNKWKDNPDYANEYQFARIMKAYMFQNMTDLYGDVPYFDAGKSLEGINYPKYDSQENIYKDILKELEDVNENLKGLNQKGGIIGTADVIYKGDTEQWRKFANSLMLRAAMRLVKVNPELAKTYANKAITNGLFTSVEDNAMVAHSDAIVTNDSAEPYGKIFSNEDPQAFYISEYFIDALKESKDPRIHLIATKCENPEEQWSAGNKFDLGDSSDAEKLIGLPIGYDLKNGDWDIKNAPNFPKLKTRNEEESDDEWRNYYALPNRLTYGRPDVPSMLVTYAQNNLLLADAAARGIIDGGAAKAEEYFKKGIQAAMDQFELYPDAGSLVRDFLPDNKVKEYINSRIVAFRENALKEINWQYYITSFGAEYEVFSNWRRSGYPEIKSVYEAPHNRPLYPNYVTKEIPRRFTYPTNESQVNKANYNEAVKNLSDGDAMSSRVWWDAK